MGLAIDGNAVHGIAHGGQSFFPITKNSNDSITVAGKNYNIEKDTTISSHYVFGLESSKNGNANVLVCKDADDISHIESFFTKKVILLWTFSFAQGTTTSLCATGIFTLNNYVSVETVSSDGKLTINDLPLNYDIGGFSLNCENYRNESDMTNGLGMLLEAKE